MRLRNFKYHYFFLILFSVIFFFLYNILNFTVPGQWDSPDETANAVFIQTVARGEGLRFRQPEDYGRLAEFVHPRSTFVQGHDILPVGFWGLPFLYGGVARIIGFSPVVFFTSILVVTAFWCFFFLLRAVFDESIALASTLISFSHPAIWYYTARSLFPNIPFISFLLVGIFFLFHRPMRERWVSSVWWIDDVIGVGLIGVALFIRPNEAIWVLPAVFFLLLALRRHIPFPRLLVWVGGALVWILVFVFMNQVVYQDTLGAYISSSSLAVPHWYSFLLPFGIDPYFIVRSLAWYAVRLWWWMSIPAFFGLLVLAWQSWRKQRKAWWLYSVVTVIISSILIVYYGSLADPLYAQKSIGVSYVRYWIPIFLLLVPLAIFFIQWSTQSYARRIRQWVLVLFVLGVSLANGWGVMSGIDGLLSTQKHLRHMQNVREHVLAITDPTAIIVSDYEDKFFWPERQVMVKFFHPDIVRAMRAFVDMDRPVYYFTSGGDPKHLFRARDHLQTAGLSLGEPVYTQAPHTLYSISVNP